jgi:hypothetical protein
MTLIWGLALCSAFEFSLPGGNSALLAGAAVPVAANAFSLNPALLSNLPSSSIQFSNAGLYDLLEVQYNRIGFGLRPLALGGSLSLLSFSGYQELTAALAKSFSLPARFSAGLQGNLYALRVPSLPDQLVPALTGGVAWQTAGFGLGCAVQNLNAPALRFGDPIPMRLLLGAGLMPVPEVMLAADAEYSESAWRFKFGAGFEVHRALFMSAGLATNPLQYAVGSTCRYRGLSASYVYHFSPRLKHTQVLGLGFSF